MNNGSRVRQLTPYKTLRDFFTYVYGEREGFAYCPTKDPQNGDWSQNFFQWPLQEREMINHFLEDLPLEKYYSPSLYSSNRISKETWLGTNVLWTELDMGIPTPEQLSENNVPEPSMRVQSSSADRQHWYWKLPFFENNPEIIEKLVRKVTYSVGGDMSAWDYQQVLRPPQTYNLKRGSREPVTVLEQSAAVYGVDAFIGLPEPPERVEVSTEDIGELPEALTVVARYKWSDEAFDLFKTKHIEKDRSNALCRLGYFCAEMGMKDVEILSILISADERWGKFKKRNDRVRRLLGIINWVRLKKPLINPEAFEDELPVFGFETFLATNIELDWIMEGLLTTRGLGLTAGPPDVGKTQWTIQLAMHIAMGKKFLLWDCVGGPRRTAFVSMEMGHAELKYFMDQMALELSPEERKLLQKNFLILPLGESLMITKQAELAKLTRLTQKYSLHGLFIDSLGVATGEGLDNDDVINPMFDSIKRNIVNPHDAFVWFVHHTRKAQVGNKKPNQLSDVMGSQYIAGHMTTAVGLWKDRPEQKEIEVNRLKGRLAKPWSSISVMRSEFLNFHEVGATEEIVEGAGRGRANSGTSNADQAGPVLTF